MGGGLVRATSNQTKHGASSWRQEGRGPTAGTVGRAGQALPISWLALTTNPCQRKQRGEKETKPGWANGRGPSPTSVISLVFHPNPNPCIVWLSEDRVCLLYSKNSGFFPWALFFSSKLWWQNYLDILTKPLRNSWIQVMNGLFYFLELSSKSIHNILSYVAKRHSECISDALSHINCLIYTQK